MDITMEGILLGLLAIAIGLAFCFYGFRLFLILLPIWGFFVGFMLGAQGTTALFGDAFLATATGWVIGFLLGLLFAVLSYLYYWIAIILLGGALGYQLTIGLFEWLNLNAEGWIAIIAGLVVGAIFAVGFFVLHMPAVLVIVATAIGGAFATVAGAAIGLGLIPYQAMQHGILGSYAAHDLGWLGVIAGIALAFAGAIYQSRAVGELTAAITEDRYMNPGVNRGTPAGPAGA
jgi:hypothetical protein